MAARSGAMGGCLWIVLLMCLMACTVQAQDDCIRQERCDACIQTPDCMWCAYPKHNNGDDSVVPHCQPTTVNTSLFCDDKDLENPKTAQTITLNVPLTTVDGEKTSRPEGDRIVQLSPQKIKLKLRKGTSETISVSYRQAQDYPVDLYYLMDLSKTMEDDKAKLAALGGKLTDTLRNLTTQFTIGFGSFVDKVMMPYAETSPKELEIPCAGCSRPYVFRNNLPLGVNSTMFTERVTAANISGNLDPPEGGFDALMQAMVCNDEIGWRDQSRRIIIFSTDGRFHYAGDGWLAGVVTPNDEKCHMNSDNEYDAYDIYDYPSIAQINEVAKRENINIIFAVSNYTDLYREVSNLIETSSHGLMNNDSSNVVELVVDQYKQISSQVRLTDNSTDSPVSIRYSSSCLNETHPYPTQECSGISQGVEVTFNLTVVADKCPKDQEKLIVEVKTLQDSLLLEIELDCNCNCESEGSTDNSSFCSHQGSKVCGVCDCFPGYQGQNCMCSISDDSGKGPEDEEACKASGEERVCSGQGACSCGACACRGQEITGKYCECNSRKCLSGMGEQCSGHGSCNCNKCECDKGYFGQFCECPIEDVCMTPGTFEVCSGHGTCDCGRCKCNQTYSGKYCDDCLTCKTGMCSKFRECVQCLFNIPPCKCNHPSTPVDTLTPYTDKGAQKCTFEDEADGCYFRFAYRYRSYDMDYDIYVLKTKDCPEKAPIMEIAFGLVAVIVLIGLLTLIIWKALTTLHDRREYQRFIEESKNGSWKPNNDLYVKPIKTTDNPMYTRT